VRRGRTASLLIGLAVAACGLGLRSRCALAQQLDAQTFAPVPGRSVSSTIPEPELPAHGTAIVGLAFGYSRWPLVRQADCEGETRVDSSCLGGGDGRTPLVSDLAQLEASVAVALFDVVQLGLVVPGVLARVADDADAPQSLRTRAGISDLRVLLDAPVITGPTALGVELALSLPSGDGRRFHGARSVSFRPALVLRQRVAGAAIALQLGYRARERQDLQGLLLDDELDAALGLRVPLVRALELRAELRARVGLSNGHAVDEREPDRKDETPGEAELAALLWPEGPFSLSIGAGAGLWSGTSQYGAPTLRGLLVARYAFEPSCKDGGQRSCAEANPEQDTDSDGDDLLGASDLCPTLAEDDDDFADHDGCPDLDDDGDGLLDAVDRCARSSEDRDGFEDDDGCAEPDNDADAIADAIDACTMDPEDRDGFEDDDGCPEPGPNAASFSVGGERILVSERIYFEYEQDAIRNVSMPVLDGLAEVISGLRTGTKVIVEGHTDDSGNPAYDLDLSFRRARAVVEYLRGRGVPADRLDFVGRGTKQPLAPGRSPEARALNRRVEFKLVR